MATAPFALSMPRHLPPLRLSDHPLQHPSVLQTIRMPRRFAPYHLILRTSASADPLKQFAFGACSR